MSTEVQALLRQAKHLTSDERTELIKYLEDSLVVDQDIAREPGNNESPDYVAGKGNG